MPPRTAALSPQFHGRLAALETLEGRNLVEAIRPRRFPPHPSTCFRCGTRTRIHRWGSFAGRQRYRCTSCLRTFSDLTGTPLARLRRLGAWTAFLEAHRRRLSVRATASHCGVHRDTAFRWRHRLLAAVRLHHWNDFERPTGQVLAVTELLVPHSRKGQEIPVPPGPPPRKRGIPHGRRYLFPKVSVLLLARSPRLGFRVVFDVAPEPGRSRRSLPALEEALSGLIARSTGLRVPRKDRLRYEWMLRQRRPPQRRGRGAKVGPPRSHGRIDPLPEAWRRELDALWPGFLVWSVCFRGVSTRYLCHYLHWFRAGWEPTPELEAIAPCADPRLRRGVRPGSRLPMPGVPAV